MFTAKVKSKSLEFGVLTVYVEFTDGKDTVVEWCKPQDEDGLKYWVKSRLEQMNASVRINDALQPNDVIEVVEEKAPVVVEDPAVTARNEWLSHYRLWTRVKATLIDTGVITASNPKAAALLAKVKTDLKPEYIDFI